MLKNLRAELARIDKDMTDIAQLLNVRYATVNDKVNGKFRFYYDEALKIKKTFFPDLSLEYLFDTESEQSEDNQTA